MKKLLITITMLLLTTLGSIGDDMDYRKIIMIDLDGVLNEYKGNYDENNIPKIRKGAREFIERLYSLDKYNLILFTTRNSLLATKWLIDNKIDKYFKDITNVKTPAYIYLDDRAVGFKGDYDKTIEDIENYKAYWR